jgi:hypothetical protein
MSTGDVLDRYAYGIRAGSFLQVSSCCSGITCEQQEAFTPVLSSAPRIQSWYIEFRMFSLQGEGKRAGQTRTHA